MCIMSTDRVKDTWSSRRHTHTRIHTFNSTSVGGHIWSLFNPLWYKMRTRNTHHTNPLVQSHLPQLRELSVCLYLFRFLFDTQTHTLRRLIRLITALTDFPGYHYILAVYCCSVPSISGICRFHKKYNTPLLLLLCSPLLLLLLTTVSYFPLFLYHTLTGIFVSGYGALSDLNPEFKNCQTSRII